MSLFVHVLHAKWHSLRERNKEREREEGTQIDFSLSTDSQLRAVAHCSATLSGANAVHASLIGARTRWLSSLTGRENAYTREREREREREGGKGEATKSRP